MSTQPSELTNKAKSGNRNPVVIIGGGLILIIALAALVFGGGIGENDEGETAVQPPSANVLQLPASGPPVAVGEQPYEFTLLDLDGNPVTLSQFGGRPVIINFWATWCGPCRIEMPHLQAAFEQRQDDGLVILALDQDEAPEAVSAFFHDEFGLTFTPVLDKGKLTAQNYGLIGTLPTTVFINPKGEITAIHRGPMVPEQIDGYLADTIQPET
ncbi:MAG: TlpA family protein disulfide reductase [Chloroflexi bacterium]|nr:TlpA family protein disulfide reductase [Chloroflexota bacterium]